MGRGNNNLIKDILVDQLDEFLRESPRNALSFPLTVTTYPDRYLLHNWRNGVRFDIEQISARWAAVHVPRACNR